MSVRRAEALMGEMQVTLREPVAYWTAVEGGVQDKWPIASLAAVALSSWNGAALALWPAREHAPCCLCLSPSHRELVAEGPSFPSSLREGEGSSLGEICSPKLEGREVLWLAARLGFPEAIQILLGDELQRRNAGRGIWASAFP